MRVVFLGSGEIGMPSLRALGEVRGIDLVGVVSQPDRPVGRGLQVKVGPVAAFARERGVSLLQPPRLRGSDAVEVLRGMNPDLFVVMAYGQILSKEVLAIPSIAPLNLHASLLPRHRGAAPIQAAILEGDTETGISVMFMAEGLDTGDVLLQKRTPILGSDTGGILHDRLADVAAEVLLEALGRIREGKLERHPQDEEKVTYARKLTKEDGRIDWKGSGEEIVRRVRAFDPWPGVYTRLRRVGEADGQEGKILKIWKAEFLLDSRETEGEEGRILRASSEGIDVRVQDGIVRIAEVQVEGRKRMGAGEFLRGFPLDGVEIGG